MGNGGSYISTSDSSSSEGSTSSAFEMIRQMSYESDVFYPDTNSLRHERPGLPDLTLEHIPAWRMEDINPVLLKYMKRSYKPCSENLKDSAKKLAELVAAQKIPKFVSAFGGSQCIKLHWACLAGWCMCRYQYQPLTPLHLMPHTRLTSSNIRKSSLDSTNNSSLSTEKSTPDDASTPKNIEVNTHSIPDLRTAEDESTPKHIELHNDNLPEFTEDNAGLHDIDIDVMAKETTV